MPIQLCLRVEVSLSTACSHVNFENFVKRLVEAEYNNVIQTLENHVIVINGFNIHVKSSNCHIVNATNGCKIGGHVERNLIDTV